MGINNEKLKYRIGLDIGIASVGFSIYETFKDGEPKKMLVAGSRVFDAAENSKNGDSLAKPRRDSRGTRRRTRRKKHRKDRIKKLLINNNFCSREDVIGDKDNLPKFFNQKGLKDIYEIRYNAISELLSNEELTRLLIHLAQKRGFKSNRKSKDEKIKNEKTKEEKTKELQKMLGAVEKNRKNIIESNYETVGELLFKNQEDKKRNTTGEYSFTFGREDIENEVDIILNKQKELGNTKITDDFIKQYKEILLSQRDFDKGPGGDSIYGGNLIKKMLGKCTFYENEPRAVKASYTYEYSILLQKINNIKIYINGVETNLTEEQKKVLINFAKTKENINYDEIKKELKLDDNAQFNMVDYNAKASPKKKNDKKQPLDEQILTIKECEKKEKFNFFKSYHILKKSFNSIEKNYIEKMSVQKIDEIAKILTLYKTDNSIREYLEGDDCEVDFTDKEKEIIYETDNFSKVGNLSLKALKEIEPYLEQGYTYDKACDEAFQKNNNNQEKYKFLPKLPDDIYEITSPVTKRAIRQTINVVNEIISRYGKPCGINIELARDMSRNPIERKKMEKANQENMKKNEAAIAKIKELTNKEKVTGGDIVKYKLFQQQDSQCLYSGEIIKIEELFTKAYEVDHIIPYSISFDDRYINKVLVKIEENQNKGNKLPLEYLKGKAADDFRVRVKSIIKDNKKRNILLKENMTDEDKNQFKARNLQDTRHATKFVKNYIEEYLEFDKTEKDGKEVKKTVVCVNGQVTSFLSKMWGIKKVRSNGDLHHAMDASVVCCVTDSLIQKVTRFNKYKENKYQKELKEDDMEYLVNKKTGEVLDEKHFPKPYKDFVKELEIRLELNKSYGENQLVLSDAKRIEDMQNKLRNLKNVKDEPLYSEKELSNLKISFVSRRLRNKTTGEVHKETLRSFVKEEDKCYTVSKVPLNKLELVTNKENGELEIKNYYNKNSDRLLYNAIFKRFKDNNITSGKGEIIKYTEDGKKKTENIFDEPLYKPKSDGSKGPLVKKVKIREPISDYIELNGGKAIANNGSMIRLDVFYVNGDGYYGVPIYVKNVLDDKLFSKAAVAGKGKPWKDMYDEDFLFSLYKNSLIKIKSKKNIPFGNYDDVRKKLKKAERQNILMNDCFVYYKAFNISSTVIKVINNDHSYVSEISINTLLEISKYEVGVLGDIYKAKKETRKYFNERQKQNKNIKRS